MLSMGGGAVGVRGGVGVDVVRDSEVPAEGAGS